MTPVLSSEVAAALADGAPIVALESTIITHGMPHPRNLETARAVEAAIRAAGAIPATIAVLDGDIRAGLSDAELVRLSEARGVMKLSRADLAVAVARGATGATTVAATMIAARRAGIAVFATGGIGGVHKGAETSFDISADLHELAKTPVTVVSAGAKAILDLPKTLEVLETFGVPVFAMGQDMFPAFWSRSSGLNAPLSAETATEIARAHLARAALGLEGGQLVANPIPAEAEIPAETLAPLIRKAQDEARLAGIVGKDVTPYLLQRIFEIRGHTPDRETASQAVARVREAVGASIPVTGDLLLLPDPQCGVLDGMDNVGLPQSTDQADDPLVVGQAAQLRFQSFAEGASMVFELGAADYSGYLYIDYYDASGTVIHVTPSEAVPLRRLETGTQVSPGADGESGLGVRMVVAPPFGRDIVVSIVTTEPLFSAPRPQSESAAAYLGDLRAAVSAASARPGYRGEWVYIVLETTAR